jgi:hypothetical protein
MYISGRGKYSKNENGSGNWGRKQDLKPGNGSKNIRMKQKDATLC